MKKWILVVIGVLIVGYAGFQWFHSKSSAQQITSQVRTATVQKGKLEVKVSGSGTVQPVIDKDIESTINNNKIDEVLVSSGDQVSKGEALITFTDGSDPITATADGTITAVNAQAGQRVTIGQAVAHIKNYSNLETVVAIDELDIPSIKVGQAASIKVSAFSDKSYTGTVTSIAREGTSTNGVSSFNVTLHFDSSKNLKVGMSTEASILTASKTNAIYVPLDAVHTANNQKYVLLSLNNAVKQQTVKTGLANEDYVEITKGLTEGETVQLPQLSTSSSSTNSNSKNGMMQSGMSGMGGPSNFGGGNRTSGRSGN